MTYVYELPGDHPAAWVASLAVKLDDSATKATVLDPLFYMKRVAIFDSSVTNVWKPVGPSGPLAVRDWLLDRVCVHRSLPFAGAAT